MGLSPALVMFRRRRGLARKEEGREGEDGGHGGRGLRDTQVTVALAIAVEERTRQGSMKGRK